MLRLVHPRKEGQEKRVSSAKSPALIPTREEQTRIGAVVFNLARAYGGVDVLSVVLNVSVRTLHEARKSASFGLAVVVARAAGIPVEQVLSGRPHVAGSCVVCGRKGAR